MSRSLHLAYYADDFTGATDALESLTLAGRNTRLFLDPPTSAQLRRYPGLQAVGVAGLSRSLPPAIMARALRPAFAALRRLRPRHVCYKVCSTFDSSPRVGSIGRAIEVGRSVFDQQAVPLLVAAPALGRYCVFGHLFARYGIGTTGQIHRLDRHPAISRHPVTPMTESDLLRHLSHQTKLRSALFALPDLELPPRAARARLRALMAEGAQIVLFDALRDRDLTPLGSLLDALVRPGRPLFSAGSSGLLAALGRRRGSAVPAVHPGPTRSPSHGAPLLVLSGSCSPVTAAQINHALAHGFAGVALHPARPGSPPEEARTLRAIVSALRAGRSVIAYTARGSPRNNALAPAVVGTALGRIGRAILSVLPIPRLVIAGGDTSSYAARALGLQSVEMIAPLIPGAPLCRAHAPGSPADGLEISFKGGQVGTPDCFSRVAG